MGIFSVLRGTMLLMGCLQLAGAFTMKCSPQLFTPLAIRDIHSSLPARRRLSPLPRGGSLSKISDRGGFYPHRMSMTNVPELGYRGIGVWLIPLPVVALQWNTFFALILLVTGKYKSALTKQGLLHSWILGCILWGTLGFDGWSVCVFYLVMGSLATKVKKAEKEAKGIAEGRGGQRGPENVWGSAATAAICSVLAIHSPWDSIIFKIGFAASLATKLSDTMASEIGKAYGKTTYLITNFERVPAGTEGAVSLEGTLAGVAGSVLLASFAFLQGIVNPLGFFMCILAAFVATNIESVIGATAQGRYPWLTNEVVNFINTAIGAIVAMSGFLLLR